MDEFDKMEEEMHQILDQMCLEPSLIETMRLLWLQQLEADRQRQDLH